MNLDYIAGFLDGEGSIIVRQRWDGKNNGTWFFRVTITQKDPTVLVLISEFLATKGFDWRMVDNKKNGSYYIMLNRVQEVERFLKLIAPRLIVKRAKAEEALDLIADRPRRGEWWTRREEYGR